LNLINLFHLRIYFVILKFLK